ncbi:MAG TPA: class I SAM-dependent methyltransferase, partial [Solirubrobacteraceae bacterium]|nr:class I SAM-dependent methyltransferase [Solirubrobacteraceae bacterium]
MRRTGTPENMALRRAERWRPPLFTPLDTRRARIIAVVRRFFDLQAGSLWRHLAPVLSGVEGTLADVGCGAQPYRRLVRASTRYVGIDTDRARDHFGYDLPDVRAIRAGERWPLQDGEADVVLATETLEHVPDPNAFLAEAFRVLRPGGQVILTTPFAARWHYIPHDHWRFTPSGLRLLLERVGFERVIVHGRGNELTVACHRILALLWPIMLPQGEDGTPHVRPAGLVV